MRPEFIDLPVAQERNPARQIGILHADHCGVTVVVGSTRQAAAGLSLAGAGRRHDHKHFAVECVGALKFAEYRDSLFIGVSGLQPAYTGSGFLGDLPLICASSSALGPAATKFLP